MNRILAEKIVNQYGGVLASDSSVFRRLSALPCSTGRIRYAFYVYIAALIDEFGGLPKEVGENLVLSYCALESFVPDNEAERLNRFSGEIKRGKLQAQNPDDGKQIEEYFVLARSALPTGKCFEEINGYIAECLDRRRTSVLNE